jgi:hypothetical protein
MEGDQWAGEKLDKSKLDKMSGMTALNEFSGYGWSRLIVADMPLQINKLVSSLSSCRLFAMRARRARARVRNNE